jgi:peptidylprolyl isomerase
MALVLVVVLAGCGSSDSDSPTVGAPSSTESSSGTGTTVGPATPTTAAATKPAVTIPDTPPPTTLQITDIVEGTGPAAAAGQKVTMQYVGVSYLTKQQFDASWDRGQPVPFTLGAGQVIKGWDQGIVGMKVGGRRQLVIPPDLGYGSNPPTTKIKPGDTLVFVVDLVKIG